MLIVCSDHWPGSDVEHVVDPQHPLEIQTQADGVIVWHEPLEAGVEVGVCIGGEIQIIQVSDGLSPDNSLWNKSLNNKS